MFISFALLLRLLCPITSSSGMTVDVQLVGLLLVLYVLRAAHWHNYAWHVLATSGIVCLSVCHKPVPCRD